MGKRSVKLVSFSAFSRALAVSLAVVASTRADTATCQINSQGQSLSVAQQSALDGYFNWMSQRVGEELPGPAADAGRDRSSDARAAALNGAGLAMQAELQVYITANGLEGKGLELGSRVRIRVLKFPEFAARLRSGGGGATASEDFYNPQPLNVSQAWAPWATQWQHGSAILELYLEDSAGVLHLFKRMPVREISGVPGPKTTEGDLQVPEGVFTLGSPRSNSQFFMEMPVGYNPRGLPGMGGSIEMHGSGVSVGCIDLGNAQVSQVAALVYAARQKGRASTLLIEPFDLADGVPADRLLSRMSVQTQQLWASRLARNPDYSDAADLASFWSRLKAQETQFLSAVDSRSTPVDSLIRINCP